MRTSIRFLKVFFKSMGFLAPIWLFLTGVIFLLGVMIARRENLPVGDGIYFAWVTAFTVGYGDIVPGGAFTRMLSLAIALTGMIFTGLWVAVAVNAVKIALGRDFTRHDHDGT
ncbi:potassium channel family protein [Kiritimatiellaeota bacterium B1221]|nr:potassium channel family protein [Kiritimatiellaeota bacterium B1221]